MGIVTGFVRRTLPVLGVLAASAAGADKPASHPPNPRGERKTAASVTAEVSPRLPREPRIEVKRRNYIDDAIFGKMERDRIPHAGLASDREFLRRLTLDLTGRIPTPDKIREFLRDERPDKRERLIAAIVEPERYAFSEEDAFVDRWAYWFSDLYRNNGGDLGTEGRNIFYDYIRMNLRMNRPYDAWVQEMLTASALTNWYSGPSNLLARYHVDDGTGNQVAHEDSCDEMAIATSRIFLGLNLECISCHDGAGHLEKINIWLAARKRAEVWRMAAFFGNLTVYRPPPRRQEFTMLERGPGFDAEAYPVKASVGYDVNAESVVRMKRWKADVTPTFLLGGERPASGEDPRKAYARMMTSSPQFARATVNWIWAELMGVGIVDPPYDFDLSRQDPKQTLPDPWTLQPTHPELLDRLAEDLRAHHFDLRYLIKLIVNSSAYQLSSHLDGEWKDDYARYFARHFIRRMSAEQIHDAISEATGDYPAIRIGGTAKRVKYAMQTRSPEDFGGDTAEIGRFLASFGQNNRSRGVETRQGTITQASLLLNSKIVKEKVKVKAGTRIHELLNREPVLSNDEIVDELFLAFLARHPSPEEKDVALEQIREYRTQGAEDLLWALVNKLDFTFNY